MRGGAGENGDWPGNLTGPGWRRGEREPKDLDAGCHDAGPVEHT